MNMTGLIDTALIVWFTLTALSAGHKWRGTRANNSELGVMNVG